MLARVTTLKRLGLTQFPMRSFSAVILGVLVLKLEKGHETALSYTDIAMPSGLIERGTQAPDSRTEPALALRAAESAAARWGGLTHLAARYQQAGEKIRLWGGV
jgi:hypothetical protein